MLTSALAGDVPASPEAPSTSAYTATRARRVRGGNAAAEALTAASGETGGKPAAVENTTSPSSQPQPIVMRAPSKRRVHRVASADQLLLLDPLLLSSPTAAAPSLPATPAGREGDLLMMVSGGSSGEEGGNNNNGNNSSSSSLLLATTPVAPLPPRLPLPPPSPSSATSSSPRKRGPSERSSQSVRPRGPPPGVAFTTAFAPMASLPPLPGNNAGKKKSAVALAADDAARAAAAAWAKAHAKARRAALLVAAAVPVPVGGSLRSAATAPCEIGGSGRRGSSVGGSSSFVSTPTLVVGGSLHGIGKAPRVTKRVGVSVAKQQRAAAVTAAAAAAQAAAVDVANAAAAAAAAQNSSLYYSYGELSASQHGALIRDSNINNASADLDASGAGVHSSSHHLDHSPNRSQHHRPRHHQEHVLVGARVAVHSPRDGAFFRATVRDVGSAAGAATGRGLPPGAALLVYDDGKAEVAHLGSRRFRLLAPRASSAGCGAGLLAAASATGAEGLRLDADCAPAPLGAGPPAGPESARRGAALLLRSPAAASGNDDGDSVENGTYLSSPETFANPASAWCRADVVGVDRAARRVRVLYADGEDEWIDLAAESARGAARVAPLGAFWPPLAPGLAPGSLRPAGHAAVGWRVALYCSQEATFFAADVAGFDSRTGLHRLAYVDGSGIVEDARLDAEAVKWVSAPECSAVLAANVSRKVDASSCLPPPHSPAPNTNGKLATPPSPRSPDACRAGSSSFSADGGNENEETTNGAAASNTNLAAYGSMGSVSCDAAATAVAALAASQRDALEAAGAAAAAVAANGAGSWDPMDAEEDPWADGEDADVVAAAVAAALPSSAAAPPSGNGDGTGNAAWWKGDAAAAGVARLTLGAGVAATAAGNACLLPATATAAEEDGDGDSKDSAVSCDAGTGRGGSSSPATPTAASKACAASAPASAPAAAPAAAAAAAAPAPALDVPAPRVARAAAFVAGGYAGSSPEDGSVHGSVAPLAALLPPSSLAFSGSNNNASSARGLDSDAAAADFHANFHGGACGALVGCGGTATAAVAALAFDTFLGGDFGNGDDGGDGEENGAALDASELGW